MSHHQRQRRQNEIGVILRLSVVGMLLAAVAFQVLGGIACDFVSVSSTGSQAASDPSNAAVIAGGGTIGLFSWSLIPTVNSSSESDGNTTLAGLGDQRWGDSDPASVPKSPTCERYGWLDDLWLASARTAMCTAAIFGGLWCAVTTTELALFQIWGSSTWIVAFSILSVVGTAVSYCVFGSPYCQPQESGGGGASCALATGGRYTAVSLSLYVISVAATACAPKSEPWLSRLRSEDRQPKVHHREPRRRRGTTNEDSRPDGFSTSSGSSGSFVNELDEADEVEC